MPKTKYIWDPVNDSYLMETDDAGNATAVYTNEPVLYGNLISQRRDGLTNWYHFDALGSTRELTNAVEMVTDTNLYDAWGVNLAQAGSTDHSFGFVGSVGYYDDIVRRMTYIRRRQLDSSAGRWTAHDPLRLVNISNRYVYVRNNAINRYDPSGLVSFWKQAWCIAKATAFSVSATACNLGQLPQCCVAVAALYQYLSDTDCDKHPDKDLLKCLAVARNACLVAAPGLPFLQKLLRRAKL